jgi:hypothetical protein
MKLVSTILAFQLFISSFAWGQKKNLELKDLSVRQVVLPSEVQGMTKRAGAIYYNKSVKGKVLIPVNVWGYVTTPGLHFVPAETSFIEALSMAGGPRENSNLENVRLIRKDKTDTITKTFNLESGGSKEAYLYRLEANDTIFVERSSYYEERAYYTSLVSVFVSILTGIFVVNQIQNQD